MKTTSQPSDIPLITTAEDLAAFCERLERVPRIAFDTEFIPEHTYEPKLCLIQVATEDELAIIDPLAGPDVSDFFDVLVKPGRQIVAHAAKEEMNFCLSRTNRLPIDLFDVQLAAGLTGLGYPLSYSNLVNRTAKVSLASSESRTDWRKRPLTPRQLDYALDDVRYLLQVRDKLVKRLESRDRLDWLRRETDVFLASIRDHRQGERWWRVSGSGNLTPRQLAVLRSLAEWRDDRARSLDRPPRWVLRDDLLVELAKKQPTAPQDLKSVRGLGSAVRSGWVESMLDAVKDGMDAPEIESTRTGKKRDSSREQMVVKILSAAMIEIAQREDVAPTLLATNEDLKNLVDWHINGVEGGFDDPPRLAVGWRAEICGDYLANLIDGKTTVRIESSKSGLKLAFDEPADRRDR